MPSFITPAQQKIADKLRILYPDAVIAIGKKIDGDGTSLYVAVMGIEESKRTPIDAGEVTVIYRD